MQKCNYNCLDLTTRKSGFQLGLQIWYITFQAFEICFALSVKFTASTKFADKSFQVAQKLTPFKLIDFFYSRSIIFMFSFLLIRKRLYVLQFHCYY